MTKDIEKNELHLDKILSKSIEIFIQKFKSILIIIVIFYILAEILFLLGIYLFSSFTTNIWMELSLIIIIISIKYFIRLIGFVGIIYIIKSKIDEKEISTKKAFQKSISKWKEILTTNIILNIFLFGLFVALIIPGIIYSIYWIFAIIIIVFKNKTEIKALDYSKKIVEGKWWKIFFYLIIFTIITGAISVAISQTLYLFLPKNAISFSIIEIIKCIPHSLFIVFLSILFINLDEIKGINTKKNSNPLKQKVS